MDKAPADAIDLGAACGMGTASMRFLARFLGLLALAGAFAAAVLDGARLVVNGAWTPTSAGAALDWLSPKALPAAREFVASRLGAWAWNDVLGKAMFTPAFVALILLGALLFLISRPPPPEIGRSSRGR